MSSTFPTPSVNAHVGLGLLSCDAENRHEESSPTQPAQADQSVTPVEKNTADLASLPESECRSQVSPARIAPKSSKQALKADAPPLPAVRHRIAEVRKSQGLTERTVAKRMGIDVRTFRTFECATTDLTISELMAVQRALEVPLIDLLEDSTALSRPVDERAKLVKTMKTAVAIRETKTGGRVGKLAEMLCNQLVDLMPELSEVSGWPQFGARRGESAIGKALSQPICTRDLHAD